MGLLTAAETTTTNMFTSDQISSITTALTSAINNVLSMFVSLLPIVAVLSGVAFGVALVRGLFKKASKAKA